MDEKAFKDYVYFSKRVYELKRFEKQVKTMSDEELLDQFGEWSERHNRAVLRYDYIEEKNPLRFRKAYAEELEITKACLKTTENSIIKESFLKNLVEKVCEETGINLPK
ncbi:MAG: hypothetical protein KC516_00805 [Nanoarchaeota archaeon]|nr:hypothetical protein [Nanoarchaeota archaeon]